MQEPEKMDAEATEPTETTSKDVSKGDMDKLIRYHVWGSIGVGLIPVPVADFVALTAIQINMLRKIANAYGVPFSKDKVKNILSSLVGGALPTTAAGPLAASVSKALPVMGQTAGVIAMPVVAGATTYAIGKVFIQHFASGGTFLTFDPEKVKAYYAEMFKEGESIAKEGKDIAKEAVTPEAEATGAADTKAADTKKDKDAKKKKS